MTPRLYHEEFHINPIPFDPAADKIQFYCAFQSCWHPGFVGQSSGGKYAIYSLVKSGISHVMRDNRVHVTCGVCFSFSRSRSAYQKAESIGPDDLVRKAIMIHHTAFHEMVSSHFFPVRQGALPLTDPDRVEEIIDRIYDELGKHLPDDALLAGLFVRLLQEVGNQQQTNIYPADLSQAMNYITMHLDDPDLSREQIASCCGISVRTLSRMFKTHLKIPIARYVIRLRLEQVCGMLALPRLTIKEIADRSGFRNSGYLIAQFRRHYGKTPREYRIRLLHPEPAGANGRFPNPAP